MTCLYCPIRIAMSRNHSQSPKVALGRRGLCPGCAAALNALVHRGKFTEAEIVANGWKLPETPETAAGRKRWANGGTR